MRSRPVVFSPRAEDQLEDLLRFITEQSGTARAEAFVEKIVSFCKNLGAFPERGTRRDDLGLGANDRISSTRNDRVSNQRRSLDHSRGLLWWPGFRDSPEKRTGIDRRRCQPESLLIPPTSALWLTPAAAPLRSPLALARGTAAARAARRASPSARRRRTPGRPRRSRRGCRSARGNRGS
jgi:plasmid stabilization system protein ParE